MISPILENIDSPITDEAAKIDAAFPIHPEDERHKLYPWKSLYPNLDRAPHRLSHTSFSLFHSCERKYDLIKNKNIGATLDTEPESKYNNTHLDYGTAFGIGLQSLLESEGDLEKAIWDTMLAYNYANETIQKNEISLVASLQSFNAIWNYDAWEMVASELSFKVILDPVTQDYYCGYLDAVIRHRISGIYAVVEGKTTGYKFENLEPIYSNSPQGIGYSLVLDRIVDDIAEAEASWTVLYIVNQLKFASHIPTLHIYPFEKKKKDKLEWLLTLQLDYQRILQYQKLGYWPQRGDKCFTFNKPCFLYGICGLGGYDSHKEARMMKKEDSWDHVFRLDELLTQQMTRA